MITLIEIDHADGTIYLNSRLIVRLDQSHRIARMLEKIFTKVAAENGEIPLGVRLKERIESRSFIVGQW